MAMKSFAAQVDAWVQKAKARQEAVFTRAAENMFIDVLARTPRATGFLANTLEASLTGPQQIRPDARPPKDAKKGSYAPAADFAGYLESGDFGLVIAGAKIGDTIFGSFGAAYARHVEYGTKFQNPAAMVRLSAQNWPHHVAQAIREAKAAVRDRSPQ